MAWRTATFFSIGSVWLMNRLTLATGGQNSYYLTASDVSGDGRPDLIVANWASSNISVFLNVANGNFIGQLYTMFDASTIEADTNVVGTSNAYRGVALDPKFSTINGGTLTVTAAKGVWLDARQVRVAALHSDRSAASVSL